MKGARKVLGRDGVVGLDLTGDVWPDIFVANDGMENFLFVNRRDGTFSNEAIPRGLAYNGQGKALANMGIAVGDVDGDGDGESGGDVDGDGGGDAVAVGPSSATRSGMAMLRVTPAWSAVRATVKLTARRMTGCRGSPSS